MLAMKRRVVITGMGCVTPLGAEVEAVHARLVAGGSGVGRLTLFDPESTPVKIAAEVRDWDVSDVGLEPARWRATPRQTQFAIGAGLKAAWQAGLDSARFDRRKFGVYLGCGEPFTDFDRFTCSISGALEGGEFRDDRYASASLRLFDPEAEDEYEPDMPAIHLAALLEARGLVSNCISACVSSTQAIGLSARAIRRGDAEIMLCGGSHSLIHPFGFTGFAGLSALSSRNADPAAAVRPFDADRDGLVIGEGAAAFILEDLDHARSRGVDILGELVGYGSSQDAFRITDPQPDGRGLAAAIGAALGDARLEPEDIDYINAHGTGTVLNDKVETLAIKRALGRRAWSVPISSTKSMLGHATTACGAIELAICLMALRWSVIPPTINLEKPDPECDLDYVPKFARDLACRRILTSNMGFGGQNAALIVSRYDEAARNVAPVRKAA
jgi:3-oxoacyl-[acyl-carrier-protein] synthase II